MLFATVTSQEEPKLEFHHLSHYLPHELKSVKYFENQTFIGEVNRMNVTNFLDGSGNAKVIMWPLRTLIEPRQFKGETIIPIVEMAKEAFYAEAMQGHIENDKAEFVSGKTCGMSDWSVKFKCPSDVCPDQVVELRVFETGHGTIEFRFFQKAHGREYGHAVNHIVQILEIMYALNMDVFRLIDKGLVTDITTIPEAMKTMEKVDESFVNKVVSDVEKGNVVSFEVHRKKRN